MARADRPLMGRFRRRSADTGQFITAAAADASPDTTVVETIPGPLLIAEFAFALCMALDTEGDLKRLSPQSMAAYQALMTAIKGV